MPRRKSAEIEVLSEEEQPKRGRKTLVEAEHTIKYNAPVPVTVEETQEALLTEDELEEVEEKRKRKPKNEREELRKKLMMGGVTPASPLKLIIERYLHSEAADSGTMAEKEYCTKYACNEPHITGQDYLDVANKWGPGRYWFTLYMKGQVVTQWEKRLGTITSVNGSQIIQNANPSDPNSPVIVQMPNQSVPFVDPIKQLKDQLTMMKLMREALGNDVVSASPPVADPDTAFVQSLLADNTKLKEKISNGLIGQILGSKAVEDDPSWGAVVMKAVEKGEVSQAIDAIGRIAVTLLDRILPRKDNNNGQAQMVTAPFPNQPGQIHNPNDATIGHQLSSVAQADSQGVQGVTQSSADATTGENQGAISPENEALQLVIDHCQKNLPVQIAFNRLMAYADAVNEQYPQGSIDGYLDMFASMPVDSALEFVKTVPNGEAVTSLPHAKEWTEQLQKLIRDSQEGDE